MRHELTWTWSKYGHKCRKYERYLTISLWCLHCLHKESLRRNCLMSIINFQKDAAYFNLLFRFLTLSIYLAAGSMLRTSLFYNKSARHEQNECNINNTSATQVWHEQHECDTSTTNDTSSTQKKNFDFENDTSENKSSHTYNNYSKWKITRRGTISF